MSKMYWVRVFFMSITLFVVILAIRYLNREKPTASPIAKLIIGSGENENIVLCPTRVVSVKTAEGLKIRQHKMRWIRETGAGQPEELNPIRVEKWFGQNCTVSGQETQSGQTFEPVLTLGYVNGTSASLLRSPSGEFQWNGRKFLSRSLANALATLPSLPLAAAPGTTPTSSEPTN